MIALLISLLGVGGIAAIALRIFGFSAIKTFLSGISLRAWLIIGAVVLAVALFFLHQHVAHKRLVQQYKAGYAKAQADDAAIAKKLKDKIDAQTVRISQLERKLNDEENRRIAASADDLRLSGPGKAVCRGYSSPARATGQSQPAARSANAPVVEVPDGQGVDLIGLPFAGAVGAGETCDLNRAEAQSWRSWYGQLEKVWPKPTP